MEEDTEVWQQVFQELIQEVKPWHKWTLTQDKDLLPDVLKPGWTQYQQKTFARFLCSSCSRSWASGCVLVVFHMHWCKKKGKGQVKMRVFAQRCNKCPEPPFAAPKFTWDNISRILNNLVFRILKKCYGEGFKEMAEIPLLGDTGLEGPHDSNNCEACLQGFCVQSSSGLASKPPARPLSPTFSQTTREPTVTVTCSSVSCSQPSSKVEKPQASKVDTQASNPTKADPKVSHTSNPSTVPILTTQQLSPVSLPAPRCVIQMPSPVKSSRTADVATKTPKALPPSSSFVPTISSSFFLPTSSSYVPPTSLFVPSTSSSYVAPTSTKVGKPQASKGDAKASNPTKADPKVSHTSKLSTVPILTIQQLSSVSSPAPRCVIQMPSPVKSSRTAGTGNKNYRSKIPETLPPSSAFVPPASSFFVSTPSSYVTPTPSYVVPNSGRPRANITRQVERSSHIHPASESCCCEACCRACHECCSKSCECCCGCFCACCKGFCECFCRCCGAACEGFCNCMEHKPFRRLVFLIFAAVVVTLFIKYGF